MSSLLLLLLALALLLPPRAHATKFAIDEPNAKQVFDKIVVLKLRNLQSTVFGLAANGRFTARISFKPDDLGEHCAAKLSLCESSNLYVRSPSFERRHPPGGDTGAYEILGGASCSATQVDKASAPCFVRNLVRGEHDYEVEAPRDVEGRKMYTIIAALCCNCTSAKLCNREDAPKVSLAGDVRFYNPETRFEELGFEEALFPILAAIGTGVLGATTLAVLLGLLTSIVVGLPKPQITILVLLACALKGLTVGLTFLYFRDVADTGRRAGWYLYVRLTISALADVVFIVVLMGLSSGFRVLPAAWFVDGRSPVFVVYIGVTLQAVIIIAVKIMFPFRYLGSFLPCSLNTVAGFPFLTLF